MATPSDNAESLSCDTCLACCCRLQVLLLSDDRVPGYLVEEDEHGRAVMARLDDGWCAALHRGSLRCTIYQQRPYLCREFAVGSAECLEERLLGGV